MNEPLTTPEPATLRCSEVDSLTSPEIKDYITKKSEEATGPEKKKMVKLLKYQLDPTIYKNRHLE